MLNLQAMLRFILICALVGGVIGLLLENRGDNGRGFTEGAKRGIGCGCGCLTAAIFLLVMLGGLLLLPLFGIFVI